MKPILEIKGISKKFKILREQKPYLSLRDSISGLFTQKSKSEEEFWALRDITFDVYPGESVGIIGRNGAGKSTLLKILSKITPPSEGRIISRGRIASLLEVGTGFHPELTGRENIYLNGSILGLKRHEINRHFDAIVDFSGVEKFLDTPLKHFSSGMQLRLAFAVAAHLEPEVLIIDEVLAVGDAEFQKKCMGKMGEVSQSGRTILFVSHDLNAITKLCNKGIVLKDGEVSFLGKVPESIECYMSDNKVSSTFINKKENGELPAVIDKITVSNTSGLSPAFYFYNEKIQVHFEIKIHDPNVKFDLFFMVVDSRKRRVFAAELNNPSAISTFEIEGNFLTRGVYSIHAFINQPNIARIHEVEDVCHFEVIDNGSNMMKHGEYDYGCVFTRGAWI